MSAKSQYDDLSCSKLNVYKRLSLAGFLSIHVLETGEEDGGPRESGLQLSLKNHHKTQIYQAFRP